MADVDRSCGEKAEMVVCIGRNNDIALRYLEGHMNKGSPVQKGRNLSVSCQHIPSNPEKGFDLNISHQDDVAILIEDRYGYDPVELFDLSDNLDSSFIENNRCRGNDWFWCGVLM